MPLLERCERDLESAAGADARALAALVHACVRYKARIVASDEREGGARAFLNFGHTVGHAIEAATAYGRFTHGEAVALGLRGALRLSHARGLLDEAAMRRGVELAGRLKIAVDRRLSPDERTSALEAMSRDKKVRGGKVRFVLLAGLGAPRVETVEAADCVRALEGSLA
jgi:3-dehydroquinate synthetase